MKRFFLLVAVLAAVSFSLNAQSVYDELKADPQRAAGNLHHYEAPEFVVDTPAPSGYTPFYVSHYGRHGSRYQTSTSGYKRLVPLFEELDKEGLLTETGKDLAADIKTLYDEHDRMEGLLTLKGGQEHQGIAQRLYDRVPEVFNQPDRNTVFCVSTPVHRVLESLANFTLSLKGNAPQLRVLVLAGDRFGDYLCYEKYNRFRSMKPFSIIDSVKTERIDAERFICSVFTDTAKAMEILSRPPKQDENAFGHRQMPAGAQNAQFAAMMRPRGMSASSFMSNVFSAGSIYGCLDRNNPDVFRYFTIDELYQLWYCDNMNILNSYGFTQENESGTTLTAQLVVKDILEKANSAVEGNNRAADLRFGHDTGIGPLLSLLKVEGYDRILSLANDDLEYWPGYRYLPMGSNLQMIFYRNEAGDVLVKLLRNENETIIPALKPFKGPYYKWSDLKAYLEGLVADCTM